MIGTVIGIIFTLIILGVLWWACQQLMALIPIAEPFKTIIYVLCVILLVVIVLWILIVILGMAGIHVNTFGLGGHGELDAPFRFARIPGTAVTAYPTTSAIYLRGLLT